MKFVKVHRVFNESASDVIAIIGSQYIERKTYQYAKVKRSHPFCCFVFEEGCISNIVIFVFTKPVFSDGLSKYLLLETCIGSIVKEAWLVFFGLMRVLSKSRDTDNTFYVCPFWPFFQKTAGIKDFISSFLQSSMGFCPLFIKNGKGLVYGTPMNNLFV